MRYARSRGLPSIRYHGCLALLNSQRPDQSSAPHSQGCLVHCYAIQRGYLHRSNLAGWRRVRSAHRYDWRGCGWPIQLAGRTHQPCDNATHVMSLRLVTAPKRYWHQLVDGQFFVQSWRPSYRAWPTCLCQFGRAHQNRRPDRYRRSSLHTPQSMLTPSYHLSGSSPRHP